MGGKGKETAAGKQAREGAGIKSEGGGGGGEGGGEWGHATGLQSIGRST